MTDDAKHKVDSQTGSHDGQLQEMRPMINIIDSSVLLRLVSGSEAYRKSLLIDDAYDPVQTIYQLFAPPRTLVIPRTVLQEVFIYEDKAYGIAVDETGKATLEVPEKAHTTAVDRRQRNAAALGKNALYWALKNREYRGEMRYYASTDEMLKSGDLDSPQGGIIIVDAIGKDAHGEAIEPVNATGEYTRFKKQSNTADEAIKNILHKMYDLEQYDRKSNAHIRILTSDKDIINTTLQYMQGAEDARVVLGANTRTFVIALRRCEQITEEALKLWTNRRYGVILDRAQERVYEDDVDTAGLSEAQRERMRSIIIDFADDFTASDPRTYREMQRSK